MDKIGDSFICLQDYTDLSMFQVPCCVVIILFILFDLMLSVCSEKQHISMEDLGWAGQGKTGQGRRVEATCADFRGTFSKDIFMGMHSQITECKLFIHCHRKGRGRELKVIEQLP